MGHQVSYRGVREVGRRKGLKVDEKAVSENLLNSSSRSQKEIPPDISKTTDT
jgi:hypothetical protein